MKKDLDIASLDDTSYYKLTSRQWYLKYKKELQEFTLRVAKDFKITKCAIIKFERKTDKTKTELGRYDVPSIIYINLEAIVETSYKNGYSFSLSSLISVIKTYIIDTLLHEYFHLLQYVNNKFVYRNHHTIYDNDTDFQKRIIKYVENPNNRQTYFYLLKNLYYIINKYNIIQRIFVDIINSHNQDSLYNNIKYRNASGFSIFINILIQYHLYDNNLKNIFVEKILGEKYYTSILGVKVGNVVYAVKNGKVWNITEMQRLNDRLHREYKNLKTIDYLFKYNQY